MCRKWFVLVAFYINFLYVNRCYLIDLDRINRIKSAVCRITCNDLTQSSCGELQNCPCNESDIVLPDIETQVFQQNELPELWCRQEDMLRVKWTYNFKIYFLEITDDLNATTFSELTSCGYQNILDLRENSSYTVKLWGVDKMKNIFSSNEIQIQTADGESDPFPVSKIRLSKPLVLKNGKYEANIIWDLPQDLSCYYEFVWYRENDPYRMGGEIQQLEVTEPENLSKVIIPDLELEGVYNVALMAKRSNGLRESSKTFINITTPTCLETYNSLKKCPPLRPKNFQVKEYVEDEKVLKNYNLYLNWSEPELKPDYYLVVIHVLEPRNESQKRTLNISGIMTSFDLKNVSLGKFYQISLQAFSTGGASAPLIQYGHMNTKGVIPVIHNGNRSRGTMATILMISIPVFGCCVLVVFLVFIYKYKQKNKLNPQDMGRSKVSEMSSIMPSGVKSTSKITDKWEISSDKMVLHSILGEGAFGIVKRARLEHPDSTITEVAVKMLKEDPTQEEVRQLKQEIDIMKSVGSHPHIVSMVGCITEDITKPILVVEYCSKGDLLGYLRHIWENIKERFENACIEEGNNSRQQVSNILYNFGTNDNLVLKEFDVLSFSRQIAMGMEYLARQKVVHRDLAARNILVCADNTVKVSDFGLSRDVYVDNVYYKTTGGKMPIKWMALECLTRQKYTTQSDVWSFGILLWEIVTLGSIPYPGVEPRELSFLLKEGYRMCKPTNCGDEIYSVMSQCWSESPNDRPSFSSLRKTFETLLEECTDYLNIDLVTSDNPEKIISNVPEEVIISSSEESYEMPAAIKTYINSWQTP